MEGEERGGDAGGKCGVDAEDVAQVGVNVGMGAWPDSGEESLLRSRALPLPLLRVGGVDGRSRGWISGASESESATKSSKVMTGPVGSSRIGREEGPATGGCGRKALVDEAATGATCPRGADSYCSSGKTPKS